MGWIKLDRQISTHELWLAEPFSKGQAWVDLLLMASHEEHKAVMGNKVVTLQPGELVRSIRFLSDRWGWSRTKVVSFLSLLEAEQMISHQKATNGVLINIENYCKYQDRDGEERATKKPQKSHQKATHKKGKEGEEVIHEGDIISARAREEGGEEAVLTFPLQGGKEYSVSDADIKEYCNAYPTINVLAELGMLRQWCLGNPEKLKKDGRRFIANWLNRSARESAIAKTAAEAAAIAKTAEPKKKWSFYDDLVKEGAI